ncbi:MAG: hypothetical protein AAFN77_13865 [Planctomycetota bacterium]
MNSIDPITMQRLVDGELELEQVQQLIKEADICPAQWRSIATAMIEDRLWEQTLRAQSNSDPLNVEALPSLLADKKSEPASHSPSIPDPSTKPTGGASAWSPHNHLLLAASLLLAIGFGYAINGLLNSERPNSGTVANQTSTNEVHDPSSSSSLAKSNSQNPLKQPTMTPAVYRPDYHLEVPNSGKLLGSNDVDMADPVPLYAVKTADQLRLYRQQNFDQSKISPKLVRQMSKAGYLVQQDIEFISGDLNKDKSFFVPVRTIRFVPQQ